MGRTTQGELSAISSTLLDRFPLILCSRLSDKLSGVAGCSLRHLQVELDCPTDRVMLESMAHITRPRALATNKVCLTKATSADSLSLVAVD
jgi:hypothetical protein